MTARVDRSFDIEIDGVGYLLAGRDGEGKGELAWQRATVKSNYYQKPIGNVQPGELEDEYVVVFDNTPALGWGEFRQETAGRYAYGANVDARIPGQITLGPLLAAQSLGSVTTSAPPVGFFELPGNANLYLLRGSSLHRIPAANPASWSTVFSGTNVTGSGTVFDGWLYWTSYDPVSGARASLRRMSAAEVLEAASAQCPFDAVCAGADSGGAAMFALDGRSGSTLWRKFQYRSLPSKPESPLVETDWSQESISLGDTGERMRYLVHFGYETFAASPIGFYGFDEYLNSVNILPELRWARYNLNGHGAVVWQGALWIPTYRGLYRYDGQGQITDVTPTGGATVRTDTNLRRFGFPTAVVGTERWLLCAMYNGTDTYVFAGREDPERGFIWHTLSRIAGRGPFTAMHVTGLAGTRPRWFLAQESGTNTIYWADLPAADNPLQDAGYAYAASGQFYTAFHDFGLPGIPKSFEEATIEIETPSASENVQVSYRMTETGSFTALGTASTSGATTFKLTPPVTGMGIQFLLTLNRGSTATVTPVVRSLKAKVKILPDRVPVYRVAVVLRDGMRDRRGKPMPNATALLQNLLDKEGGQTPFGVVDPFGISRTCLLEGPVGIQGMQQETDNRPSFVATFMLREVLP